MWVCCEAGPDWEPDWGPGSALGSGIGSAVTPTGGRSPEVAEEAEGGEAGEAGVWEAGAWEAGTDGVDTVGTGSAAEAEECWGSEGVELGTIGQATDHDGE